MYLKYSKTRIVKTPIRANPGDAIDLFVPDDFTPVMLKNMESVVIPSGIKFEIPFGYAMVMTNKSGIAANKSLIIGACLIDHGYAGEVHIDIHNIGLQYQCISPGDKISQVILIPVMTPGLIEVDETELYSDILVASSRGTGKFGSTGV